MTSTAIYHVPRYIVVYQSNFFKAPSAPPGAPRTHPDWIPFSSSPKLSLPPHGVAWGGAWGPRWDLQSWKLDLRRQFLLDLHHQARRMLYGKRLAVPLKAVWNTELAKAYAETVHGTNRGYTKHRL